MNMRSSGSSAVHITIETGGIAEIPHLLATNRYGTYCIPNDFKKREVPRILRAGQVYENDTLEFLRRHIGSGDIVTGGAFVGDFFPALHEALGKSARIHSFEPSPLSFDACAYTMALNGLTQVTLHRCAVGSAAGTASLAVARGKDKASLAAGMRIAKNADATLHTITVPILPIDDLVPASREVSVLHLDVEGFEIDALQGARHILETSRPIVVLEGAKPFKVRRYLDTLRKIAPKAGYLHAGRVDHNSVYRPSLA